MINHNEIERARSALQSISPDLHHDEWVRVGMAAHAGGLSFDDWDGWSQQGSDYTPTNARDAWRSFSDKPGGIGVGTLFRVAKEHGWTDPRERKAGNDWTPVRIPPKPAQPPAPPIPASAAAMALWERYEPATYDHPYLVQKGAQGVPLGDLRVVPQGENLHLLGGRYCVDGALVVPAYGSNGLLSLQYIVVGEVGERMKAEGKPSKVCMRDTPMGDGFHVVGKIEPGARVFVCEGIGAAWACWQATGEAAVSCFGWGRVNTVAKCLRAQDATAHLVLVPDVGKEVSAKKVAEEHGCAVAYMPEGFATNSDVNDFAASYGLETLSDLLDSAQQPAPAPEPLESHVMAKFLEVDLNPRAAKWLIPGLIEEGAVTIAGGRGVGKTTCVVPLSAVAAGLHAFGDPLAPKAWRHVIYVTEHADQVMRILSALVQHGGLGINPDDVRERFHLVHAARILSGEMVQVGPLYRKRYGRMHKGVEVRPLVVLDTLAACVAMESENDNAEASNAMANIKQRFEGLPVWLIAHVAKDAIGRSNTQNITARGAGAFEADAIQNLYIVPEADKRYLVIGKMRCEPRFGTELEIDSGQAVVDAVDEWGDTERTTVRWGVTRPIEKNRAEARQEAQEATRKAEERESRGAMIDAVLTAQAIGHPLSRTSLKSKSGMKATEAIGLIQQLMDEGWIHEIDVPTKRRLNAKKASFLVALTTEQHDRWMAKHEFPPELSIIPPSWCKAEEAVASDNTESAPEGGSTPTQTHPDGATDSGVEDLEFRSFPTSPEFATDSGVPESEIPFVPKAFVPYRQKQRERTGMVGAHSPFISPISDDGNERERTGTNGNERACFSEIEAKNPPISGADHLTGADDVEDF